MPVIQSLFGGSRGDDLISFSARNRRDVIGGLFPSSPRDPAGRKTLPFLDALGAEAPGHRVTGAGPQGLGKVPAGSESSRGCGEQRSGKPRHRYVAAPEVAEVDRASAAVGAASKKGGCAEEH